MSGTGRWDSWAARVYYTLGAAFYVYKWLLATGAIGLVSSFFFYIPTASVTLLYLGTIPSILLLSLGGWHARQAFFYLYSGYKGLNPHLTEIDHYVTYSYLGDTRYRLKRDFRVRAARSGVDSHRIKSSWSGKGEIEAWTDNPNIKVQLEEALYSTDWSTRTLFLRPLQKNEEIEFSHTLELSDEEGSARPFLAVFVNNPIKHKLRLRVALPEFQHLKTFNREILLSQASDMPIWYQVSKAVDNQREIDWEIKRPRLGCRYRITWDTDDAGDTSNDNKS